MGTSFLKYALIFFFLFIFSGCTYGWLYQDTTEPHCTNMRNTPVGEKNSSAELRQVNIPRLPGARVMWDANSIGDAARAQGLTEVSYCDKYTFRLIGGLWQQERIIVYGK